MRAIRWEPVVVAICAIVTGCATVSLNPGAEQIKVTHNAADVSNCASVGNLTTPPMMMTDPDAERQLQNETLGLGGNVLLLASSMSRMGIAYRCGDAATTSSGQTPAPPAAKAVPAPPEIVQAQVEAYNRRDLDGFLSFYADDAQIFDYPDRLLMSGKDAMREGYRKLFEPAPQLHAAILHRIAFDRFVIDQEKVTGRQDGVTIEAVAIYEVRDGRIVRVTFLRH
jgi:hypothetical protein